MSLRCNFSGTGLGTMNLKSKLSPPGSPNVTLLDFFEDPLRIRFLLKRKFEVFRELPERLANAFVSVTTEMLLRVWQEISDILSDNGGKYTRYFIYLSNFKT